MVAERRRDRVQRWISSNTMDFCDNDEVERLVLEADVILGKIKQGLLSVDKNVVNIFEMCA